MVLLGLVFLVFISYGQYPNNEEGQYEDMLTPEYYNTANGGAFRLEVNKFVHFARQLPFQHPFEDSLGQIPGYNVQRSFGDGIGPGGTGSHHPAFDYYLRRSTQVNMYAAHDGVVSISRDVSRYRHSLSITTDIKDSLHQTIGKMVTIYAHIDLDLDSTDHIHVDGQYVNKGDLVSKHLYAGTMGGPHLHFEIRYYRPNDSGLEDFYGGKVGENTAPSSGSWTYGFWNPSSGYGFAHPLNHITTAASPTKENGFYKPIILFPNPTRDAFRAEIPGLIENTKIELLNQQGQILEYHQLRNNKVKIDLSSYPSGIYFTRFSNGQNYYVAKILKE
jgi:murein DD-endopeptidase MepM/ murein hydrolase activator NlpD